jgi:hypothetical protein
LYAWITARQIPEKVCMAERTAIKSAWNEKDGGDGDEDLEGTPD